MEEFIVGKQITVRAPIEKVWTAITNPDLTEKYFFGCRVNSTWNTGDTITFEKMILWIFPLKLSGRIVKINRGTLLQYSLKNSKSTTESMVTFELYEEAGKTIVSITDDVGQGEGAEDRYERSLKGWDKVLNGLKQVVEDEHVK